MMTKSVSYVGLVFLLAAAAWQARSSPRADSFRSLTAPGTQPARRSSSQHVDAAVEPGAKRQASDDTGAHPDGGETDEPGTSASALTPPASPIGLVTDLFHNGCRLGDDLVQQAAGLDREQQNRIGTAVRRQILAHNTVLAQPSSQMQELARRVLKAEGLATDDFTFTVIDSDQINAFAHLGGHVYLFRGLLEQTESDAERLFVLAHEIAHVQLMHCGRMATYTKLSRDVAGSLGGAAAQLIYRGISRGYSEQLELESDRWAYRALGKLKFGHQDRVAFLQRLHSLETQRARADSRPSSLIVATVGDHFRSHPPASLRIRSLEQLQQRLTKRPAK